MVKCRLPVPSLRDFAYQPTFSGASIGIWLGSSKTKSKLKGLNALEMLVQTAAKFRSARSLLRHQTARVRIVIDEEQRRSYRKPYWYRSGTSLDCAEDKRDGGSIDLHRCTADNPLKGSMAMWMRFLRFVVVGLANTVFGYAVFAALYLVLNAYRPAIVIATVIGVLFNFLSTGSAVFANRSIRAFVPYMLGYAIVCGINIFLVDWLVALGSKPLLAQMTVLPFLAVISFVINDRIVFGRLA
jgi:putative flippase GtrA